LTLRRGREKQIVDFEGKVIGVFLPPTLTEKECDDIWMSLKEMEHIATTRAGEKRGEFMTMTYGIQKGAGSGVSKIVHSIQFKLLRK
jgi:hypothetical protein